MGHPVNDVQDYIALKQLEHFHHTYPACHESKELSNIRKGSTNHKIKMGGPNGKDQIIYPVENLKLR